MNSRYSGRLSALRSIHASVPISRTAARTAWIGVPGGNGSPNATVTGYGMRRGILVTKRPPALLKILPQTRSSATGMMGTSRPVTMRWKPR